MPSAIFTGRADVADQRLLSYYQQNFAKYGVHERSLGWTKGKQNLRFFQLTRHFDLANAEVIDIGSGFGDFNHYLVKQNISVAQYVGIDVVPEFIDVAKTRWPQVNRRFVLGNYLALEKLQADYIFASGIFGLRVADADDEQYGYVRAVVAKAFAEARRGVSFDFISDKVDFRSGTTDFHASPARILSIAYEFSKNVMLDNTAMPFEFSVTIFKDDSFLPATTVFNRTLAAHPDLVETPKP